MPPTELLNALQAIRGRVRSLAILFGVGVCAALAVGLLLAVVFLDWALVLPVPARAALLVAAVAALAAGIYHWLIQPAMSKLAISDVAGRLEHAFPQFDDRLRSTVNFLNKENPGSEKLKQQVIDQASQMARTVDLGRVVRPQPMWFALAGGMASIAVVALLMIFGNRAYVSAATNRFWLGQAQWPKMVQIAMDGNVPHRVPVGQRVPIRIKLAKGDRSSRKAFISYRYDNGPWQQELMTRADGVYTAALDARLEPNKTGGKLAVKIEAGDDLQELPAIDVVSRLEVTRVEAETTPPPYVKAQRVSTVNFTEQPAIVGIGSNVAIHLQFNKPLAAGSAVELRPIAGQKLPESARSITWDRPSESLAIARLQAVEPLRFTIHATDIDGFENTGTTEMEVIVRDDQLPSVQIEEPRRSEDRTPDAEFDLKAVAEDDYGIDNAAPRCEAIWRKDHHAGQRLDGRPRERCRGYPRNHVGSR